MTLEENDEKDMLDWEKANAVEHVRRVSNNEQKTSENRVIAINERCV